MDCLWPGVGMTWIPIHELLNATGPARAIGIMYFQAFTECDVVSAFRGKGKKSAWQTWDVFDEVTETSRNLSQFTTEVTDTDLNTLERFVVLMYDLGLLFSCIVIHENNKPL